MSGIRCNSCDHPLDRCVCDHAIVSKIAGTEPEVRLATMAQIAELKIRLDECERMLGIPRKSEEGVA